MKCYICDKETTLNCTLCGKPICEDHISVAESGDGLLKIATCPACKETLEAMLGGEPEEEEDG